MSTLWRRSRTSCETDESTGERESWRGEASIVEFVFETLSPPPNRQLVLAHRPATNRQPQLTCKAHLKPPADLCRGRLLTRDAAIPTCTRGCRVTHMAAISPL